MRHTVLIVVLLTISACTGCATMGLHREADACESVRDASLADRITDPCGYADALARCAGLPLIERTAIVARCEAELESVKAADRLEAERASAAHGNTCTGAE